MMSYNEKIEQNKDLVYNYIQQLQCCKFTELQQQCRIENADLCITLIYLLRTGKIQQKWLKDGVFYCVEDNEY